MESTKKASAQQAAHTCTPLRPWAAGAHTLQAVRACSSEQKPSVLKVTEQARDVQPQRNDRAVQSLFSSGNGTHPASPQPPQTPEQSSNGQETQHQTFLEPQLITSLIVSARSVDELQRVVEANSHELNRIHAAAALVRLAKLCSTPPAQQYAGNINGDVSSRKKEASPASSQSTHAHQHTHGNSVTLTPASSFASWPVQDTWGAELPRRASAAGLSDGPAAVSGPNTEASQRVQALAGNLEQRFAHSTQRLHTIRQHANVCWALGRLGHEPSLTLKRSLRRRLASYAEPIQATPDSRIGQEIANLAHGLAQLGLVDPSVWLVVCQVVEVQAHHCSPMELAHLGWALARTVEATEEQQQHGVQHATGGAAGMYSSSSCSSSSSSSQPQAAGGSADLRDPSPSPELKRGSPSHIPAAQLPTHHPPPAPNTQHTMQTAHQQRLHRPQRPNQQQQQEQQQQGQQASQGPLHLQHSAEQLHSRLQPIPFQVLHPPEPPLSSTTHPATLNHQPQHQGQSGLPAGAQRTSQGAQHASWFPPPPHRPSRRPLHQKPIARPLPAASPQQEQLPQVTPVLQSQPSCPSNHSVHQPLQQEECAQQQQAPLPARPVLPATQTVLQPPRPRHVHISAATSAAWSFQFEHLRGALRAALGCVAEVACSRLKKFKPGELITLLTACAKGPCPPKALGPMFEHSLPELVRDAHVGRLSTHDVGNSAWAYARARQVGPGQELLQVLQDCLLGHGSQEWSSRGQDLSLRQSDVSLGQPGGASSSSSSKSRSSRNGNLRELSTVAHTIENSSETSPSKPALPPLSAFSHQELSNVLWACAVLGSQDGAGGSLLAEGRGDSLDLRGGQVPGNSSIDDDARISKRDVGSDASSAAAAAAAAAAVASGAFIKALAGELGSRSVQLDAEALATSAWSLATLGYADFGPYAQLLQAAGPKASQFNNQELANLLWALSTAWQVCGSHAGWARLQRSPSTALLMHTAFARAPFLKPVQLAQLAWFVGWLADTQDVLPPLESVSPQPQHQGQQQLWLLQQQQQYKQLQCQLVEALSRSARTQLSAFKPADLVVFAGGMSRAQRHAPNALLFDALAGTAIPMLRAGQLNPQAMASLAASFARARQRNLGFASAMAAAATAVGLQRFTPVQLANLLWALTSMRVQDRELLARAASVLLQGPLASLRSHSASATAAPAAISVPPPASAPASSNSSNSSPVQLPPTATLTSSPAQPPSPTTTPPPQSPQGSHCCAQEVPRIASGASSGLGESDPGQSGTGAAPTAVRTTGSRRAEEAPTAVGMSDNRRGEETCVPPPDASQTPNLPNAWGASEASGGHGDEQSEGGHAYTGWRDGRPSQGVAEDGQAARSSSSNSSGKEVESEQESSIDSSGRRGTRGRIDSSSSSSSRGKLWAEASTPPRAHSPSPSPIHTHNLSHTHSDATSTSGSSSGSASSTSSTSGQEHIYGLEMSGPHMTWSVLAWVFARSNYHQHRLYDRLALAVLLGLDEYGNVSSSSSSSSIGDGTPSRLAVPLVPEPPSLHASSSQSVCDPPAPGSSIPRGTLASSVAPGAPTSSVSPNTSASSSSPGAPASSASASGHTQPSPLPAAAPGTAALRALSNPCLVQLLWAYAVHDHRYEALLQAAAPLLAARVAVGGMTPPQVACIAWAYARLQHHAPILFRAILKHALAEADRFDLRCWSRLAWAFSTLCLPGNALFPRLQQLQQEKDALCQRRSLVRSAHPAGSAGYPRRQSSGRESDAVMEDSGVPILPSREIW